VLVEVQEGGLSQIVGSTFVGNESGGRGGALFVTTGDGSSLAIANSTFTANQSTEDGGAIDLEGEDLSSTIEGSTVAANHAIGAGAEGGGIADFSIQRLTDTVVVANTASAAPNLDGKWVAAFDLLGDGSGTELTETAPGSNLIGVDPQLGPLAANGGPTETMALPPSSPAVNKGGGALTTDQRGDPRPVIYPGVSLSSTPGANGSDIGAYELSSPPATGGPPPPPVAPVLPTAAVKGPPRVRISCPKGARPDGCLFALQVVSAKPHKAKGKGGRAKQPLAETAVAKARLREGKSTLLTLTPKPGFAAKLDAAKQLLVREVKTIDGLTRTTYRQ
jgi:hypothetical protein